ncbi:MAG: cupin [Gammaproteobacteria bacterium]|nr:MAG: cupin [Gammaproteobacteria bacterium]
MAAFFNTGLTQQQFLDEYWQKKPLLIRQAFTDFESPISPEELAGLACEDDIESRLIEERGPDSAWQVTNGPLSEQDFARLPETDWTMLVQDVDKHIPEFQALLDPFRFIPNWRRDDLMVSYAPQGGTVGPHTDGYDVFLLQAMGSRHWQVGGKAIHDAKIVEDLSLQILAEFDPEQEWDLQPGDMLYLPPHFAHHGVALNDCMTFSIGFRAPSRTDLLDGVINTLLEHELGKARYSDADLLVSADSSEIDEAAVQRLTKLLHDAIDESTPLLAQVLGKFVTETKQSLVSFAAETEDELSNVDALDQQFSQGQQLQRSVYHRFAWTKIADKTQLFMAGEVYELPVSSGGYLAMLTENQIIGEQDWQQLKQDPAVANLLCQLIAEGGWFWQ